MQTLFHSTWGAIHLLTAAASLVLGTAVLLVPKQNPFHKPAGYAYLAGMTTMITTAFGIYRQYGGFGIFHAAAILTGLTLLAGMVPVLWRKRIRHPLRWHYGFMYLSVLELYIALVAELLVRTPGATFGRVAALSSAVVLIPGGLLFFTRLAKRWQGRVRYPATFSWEGDDLKRAA
ncbi:MAG: hypothetical protein ICV83_15895 [Cytophagales bacterium]|nr:hypothetical protein [Cytophagales bacterium]